MRVWIKGSGKYFYLLNKVEFDEIKDLNMLMLFCRLVKFWNIVKKNLLVSERWKNYYYCRLYWMRNFWLIFVVILDYICMSVINCIVSNDVRVEFGCFIKFIYI